MHKNMNNSKLSDRDLEALLYYIIGEPVASVVEKSGIPQTTLYKLIKSYGIPLKSHTETYKHYRNEIFVRARKQNKSVSTIARELNLPVELIDRYLKHEFLKIQQKQARGELASSAQPKPSNGLGKDGLIGHLPSSNKPGLSISQTLEEEQKRESVKDDSSVEVFADMLGEGYDEEEQLKLYLLRALLKHASEKTDMYDYSEDPLLLPDYLLPIDLVIMKDITKRSISGEKVRSIASVHRTDERLVSDLLTKGLSRDVFRDRFIKSLVDRGLIQF